jgi:hypothetical protein
MWIAALLLGFGLGGICEYFRRERELRRQHTKEGTPSTSTNTGMLANAQICQDIVEDQLDYLIRIGLDFKEGEKDSIRDSLYRIVAGKLQHT